MGSGNTRKVPNCSIFSEKNWHHKFLFQGHAPYKNAWLHSGQFLSISYIKAHFYSHLEYSTSMVISEILYLAVWNRNTNYCDSIKGGFYFTFTTRTLAVDTLRQVLLFE